VAGLLDLQPREPDALGRFASARRLVREGAGDGEGQREGCERQMREGIDGRGGSGRLKKTDVWVPHVSEVREME
jgi:hypothetical protein